MRGIGCELALLGEGPAEAIEHVVEGLGEGAQLLGVPRARVEPWREVARVDLGGGGGKPPQRRCRAGSEEVAGDERRDQGRPGGEQQSLFGIGLSIGDRGDPRFLARLPVLPRGVRLLPALLPLDDVRLVSHLSPDRDEDEAEGENDDRSDRERQPSAQAEPPPSRPHARSLNR
jgi:hypothetical protein